jgi:hypothetical protein
MADREFDAQVDRRTKVFRDGPTILARQLQSLREDTPQALRSAGTPEGGR